MISRYRLTAQMLANLDVQISTDAFIVAAVVVGHFVGLEMADDWPNPAPSDPAGWISLIDGLLAKAKATREEVVADCEKLIEKWTPRAAQEKAEFMTHAVTKAIDDDRLTKMLRVEAHLGRELSRNMSLLRTLQQDRRTSESEPPADGS